MLAKTADDHDELRAARERRRSGRRAARRSDVVSRGRHHPGRARIASASAQAARARAGPLGRQGVAGLVVAHLLDDRARRQVVGRQALEVARRGGARPAARSRRRSRGPRRRRPAPPARPITKAPAYQSGLSRLGRAPSSLQALGGPGEVIGLLAGGRLELPAQRRVRCRERLGAVERLRADLADMVDAHQGARAVVARRRRARGAGPVATGVGHGRPCGVLVEGPQGAGRRRSTPGPGRSVGARLMHGPRIACGGPRASGGNPRCAKTT